LREFAFIELEAEGPFADDDHARYADREWDEIEAAGAEGRWEDIGIDSTPLQFESSSIDDLKDAAGA
jgi:hypothetical protein